MPTRLFLFAFKKPQITFYDYHVATRAALLAFYTFMLHKMNQTSQLHFICSSEKSEYEITGS
ncbi:CLUMA_CG016930, isoform A [Clunio marinus]|uniref:CLUMA_CG016930, isoform A n=1 Tax=Clunio marinus TaxID=568069 RepID=A0A1J1IYG5_9DIPT|nr:CLUMA_CG016930, isoform A [Clunio marinus]